MPYNFKKLYLFLAASPVKKTRGRPRKKPIPLEVIKESDISDTTHSSRKSESTSSVSSQHPEPPSVTRSRSHSSATTLVVIKESDISVVKKRPGQSPRKISESEEKSQPIVKMTPSQSANGENPGLLTEENSLIEVDELTDTQLASNLKEFGVDVGPIFGKYK